MIVDGEDSFPTACTKPRLESPSLPLQSTHKNSSQSSIRGAAKQSFLSVASRSVAHWFWSLLGLKSSSTVGVEYAPHLSGVGAVPAGSGPREADAGIDQTPSAGSQSGGAASHSSGAAVSGPSRSTPKVSTRRPTDLTGRHKVIIIIDSQVQYDAVSMQSERDFDAVEESIFEAAGGHVMDGSSSRVSKGISMPPPTWILSLLSSKVPYIAEAIGLSHGSTAADLAVAGLESIVVPVQVFSEAWVDADGQLPAQAHQLLHPIPETGQDPGSTTVKQTTWCYGDVSML